MTNLDELLAKTSRTFALAIPLLPEPTRREVSVAYLVLRIADSIEDARAVSVEEKVRLLTELGSALASPRPTCPRLREQSQAVAAGLGEGCAQLLSQAQGVLDALVALRPRARHLIARYAAMTTEGMASGVEEAPSSTSLELKTLPQLQRYCYVVAGLVGELLTELFLVEYDPPAEVASRLRGTARAFGEGLQLTNILKDEREDLAAGRRFLPAGGSKKAVFDLARADLRLAEQYIQALSRSGAPSGFVAFTTLPVRLAWETLAAVETQGAGAKVSRQRVAEILGAVLSQPATSSSASAP